MVGFEPTTPLRNGALFRAELHVDWKKVPCSGIQTHVSNDGEPHRELPSVLCGRCPITRRCSA